MNPGCTANRGLRPPADPALLAGVVDQAGQLSCSGDASPRPDPHTRPPGRGGERGWRLECSPLLEPDVFGVECVTVDYSNL